jgi:endonuclease G
MHGLINSTACRRAGFPLLLLTCLTALTQVLTPENRHDLIRSSDNLIAGLPSEGGTIVNRDSYALCYSEQHEQAVWVAYKLTAAEVTARVASRTDDFREDPLIPAGSASSADYRRSGYDRGHLAPAGDMTWSRDAMSESFYLSNMSPQEPSFNRGVWRKLETLVRTWASENDAVYVVTGPVLTGEPKRTIGPNRVTVPLFYYKVVLDVQKPGLKAIGFLLPNEGSRNALAGFAVTVDRVEEVTGLDFYSRLPDELENSLEGTIDLTLWNWRAADAGAAGGSDDEEAESAADGDIEGGYVASRRSTKFHRPDCRYVDRISPANIVRYRTREEAMEDGRKPCAVCRP